MLLVRFSYVYTVFITCLTSLYTVDMYNSGSSVTLPVSQCVLLDVGRGYNALSVGGQSVWQWN